MPIFFRFLIAAGSVCESHPETAAFEKICSPEGLGFEETLERALAVSVDVASVRAQVEDAEAQARREAFAFLPRVEGRISYDRLNDVENPPLNAPLSVETLAAVESDIASLSDLSAQSLWRRELSTQITGSSVRFPVIQDNYAGEATLTWSVVRNLLAPLSSTRAATNALGAERSQAYVVRRDVRLNAALAYLTVALAKGREVIAQESVRRSLSIQREVSSQSESGAALRADLLRVQAQTARFDGQLAEARNSRIRSVRDLRTLLRMAPADDVELRVDVAQSEWTGVEYEVALARAFENRDDLDRLRHLARSSESRRNAVAWQLLPDVVVSGSARRARPNPRILPPVDEFRGDWRLGVAVSWSPTDFLTTRAEKQSADAAALRSALEVQRYEDRIRNDVALSLEGLNTADALRSTATVELRAARESYRVKRLQYPAGLTTLSDLIDSEAEFIAAELRLLNASVQAVLAKEQLDRSLGLTLSAD